MEAFAEINDGVAYTFVDGKTISERFGSDGS